MCYVVVQGTDYVTTPTYILDKFLFGNAVTILGYENGNTYNKTD